VAGGEGGGGGGGGRGAGPGRAVRPVGCVRGGECAGQRGEGCRYRGECPVRRGAGGWTGGGGWRSDGVIGLRGWGDQVVLGGGEGRAGRGGRVGGAVDVRRR